MNSQTDRFAFGCMRLPLTDPADMSSVDIKAASDLFDFYLERGGRYFDTAYTYHCYRAEKIMNRCLVSRHRRDSFELASKLPLRDFHSRHDMERIFSEQLENCGTDYFDYYLLHNYGMNVHAKCTEMDVFHFIAEKKKAGIVGKTGISFHDTPELLDSILNDYGECLDFVQLQINYIDWDYPAVQSRRCYDTAVRHGKPVFVMEPCKGGVLANLSGPAADVFAECSPGASAASFAMRFVLGLDHVEKILSGMNSQEQLEDNIRTFSDYRPLDENEMACIEKVREIIRSEQAVPCTGCGYCEDHCPVHIPVSRYFALYNSFMRQNINSSSQHVYLRNLGLATAKAGDCIGCGICERNCPQHIDIRRHLKAVAEKMENIKGPVRK